MVIKFKRLFSQYPVVYEQVYISPIFGNQALPQKKKKKFNQVYFNKLKIGKLNLLPVVANPACDRIINKNTPCILLS